jgi:hypothetical protein
MNAPPKVARCPYCGSSDVAADVLVNQLADAGRIGLAYKSGVFLTRTAAFYVELCRQCGSVVRLYVKETGKNWKSGQTPPRRS